MKFISQFIAVLILVERTFYAQKICEYLKNHLQLKVRWLVGQNSFGSKRLNTKETSVIQNFRNGLAFSYN